MIAVIILRWSLNFWRRERERERKMIEIVSVQFQFHNLMTTSKDQMNNNAQKVYMGFKPRAAADVGPKT